MTKVKKLKTSSSKKKKKKSRYHTGIYKSKKAGPIKYRSGWEYEVARYFDNHPDVIEFAYESLIIPYISNQKTGKIRKYYPDFLVWYTDGTKKLIEVKAGNKINDLKVVKKSNAAREWCEKNNAIFEIWSNSTISTIKKINESNEICLQQLPINNQFPLLETTPTKLISDLILAPLPQASVF
jgi:hypothetical protein